MGPAGNEIWVFTDFVVLDDFIRRGLACQEGRSFLFLLYEGGYVEVKVPLRISMSIRMTSLVGLREAGRQIAGYVCLAGTRSGTN